MTAVASKPRTAADRQRDLRKRRAGTLFATLDRDHAEMLATILAGTGEKAAAWVRRMIREQAKLAEPALPDDE
jgi:hypothetical protein